MSLLPTPLSKWQKAIQQEPNPSLATAIIAEYFSFFGAAAAKDELWLLTAATLTNDEVEQNKTGHSRADLLFYYEFTKMFIDAVQYLHPAAGRQEAG